MFNGDSQGESSHSVMEAHWWPASFGRIVICFFPEMGSRIASIFSGQDSRYLDQKNAVEEELPQITY